MQMEQKEWSEWLDFSENTIKNISNSAGVFMMHSSMKILFIEGTEDIKKSIEGKMKHPCITNTTRLRYMNTPDYEKIANELITDYKRMWF